MQAPAPRIGVCQTPRARAECIRSLIGVGYGPLEQELDRLRLQRVGLAAVGLSALVLSACAAVHITTTPGAKAVKLPSNSMAPTYKLGDILVYRPGGRPRIGDVVVFHPPSGFEQGAMQCGAAVEGLCATATDHASSQLQVKRIVGVGGDRIAIKDGRVIRNGELAAEPFIKPCHDRGLCSFPGSIRVSSGSFYVLGDNRGASDDSRFFGPVISGYIVGKVIK
jgi:signal peptidase I